MLLISVFLLQILYSACVDSKLGLRSHPNLRLQPGLYDPVIETSYSQLLKLQSTQQFVLNKESMISKLENAIMQRLSRYRMRARFIMEVPVGVLQRRRLVLYDPKNAGRFLFNEQLLTTRCFDFPGRFEILRYMKWNLDKLCTVVWKTTDFYATRACHLPTLCVDVKVFHYQDLVVCVGVHESMFSTVPILKYDSHPIWNMTLLDAPFQSFCNLTDDTLHSFPDSFIFNLTNFEFAQHVLHYRHPHLVASDGGYIHLVGMLQSQYIPAQVSTYPIAYICDDRLFRVTQVVDNVNVFRSPRGCRYHVKVSDFYQKPTPAGVHCVDYLYDPEFHYRCPSDWIDVAQLSDDHLLASFLVQEPRNDTWTMIKHTVRWVLDELRTLPFVVKIHGLMGFASEMRQSSAQVASILAEALREITNAIQSSLQLDVSLGKIFKGLAKFLGFENTFNVRLFARDTIDYFFRVLVANDSSKVDFGRTANLFGIDIGKWLTDALMTVLKPFWRLFLDVLDDALQMILEFLVQITPIIEQFCQHVERSLEALMMALFRLLQVLLSLILHLFVFVERKVFLSEYLLVFVVLSYKLRSPIPAAVVLILLILILGLSRKFPSLLLLLLNNEFRNIIHSTSILDESYVDYYVNITFRSVNVTHGEMIFEVTGLDMFVVQFVDYSPLRRIQEIYDGFEAKVFVDRASRMMLQSRFNVTIIEMWQLFLQSFVDRHFPEEL